MSHRAAELASQYEQAANEFVETVQGMSDEQWKMTSAEEGWSVAAAAHHAAIGTEPLTTFVELASSGQPLPPIMPEQLDAINAQHAKDFVDASKADVLAVFDKHVTTTAALLRSLTDEQLDKEAQTPFGGGMTTEQIIRNVLIGHQQQHLASIKAAK